LAWASVAAAQPVTLRMWMHEHPPRVPIDKQIVAEFEKVNPDIKVDHEIIPVAEYPTKLLTAFAAGSGPDIFNQASMLVAQYYNARVLAPIDYAAMGLADEAASPRNLPAASTGSGSRASSMAFPPRSATGPASPTMRSGVRRVSIPTRTFPRPGRHSPRSPKS